VRAFHQLGASLIHARKSDSALFHLGFALKGLPASWYSAANSQ